MKSNIIRLIIIIIFFSAMFLLSNKELIVTRLIEKDNLIFEYNEDIYVKDIIKLENGSLLNNEELIDTSKLGDNTLTIKYKNSRITLNHKLNYSVIDTTPPVILGSNSYTIKKGDAISLIDKMLCGDNYDKRPTCTIEGEYDTNNVGEYNLKYVAKDTSDNISEKEFKLIVKSSISNNRSSDPVSTPINEYISNYKNEETMIGIDVSSWQGYIDWNKVKESGVEFAMIRIGFGYKGNDEIVYDSTFTNNLKNAKLAGIKVGLYFYTYAHNEKEASSQSEWIVNELKGEKLDLPIAFDWEIWDKFNSYNISISDLNNIALSFINTLNNNGYEGMLYSSYYYLSNIWSVKNSKIWLAHYAKETDYPDDYYIWQLSNTGSVPGINGYVDVNILYK